MYDTRKWNDEGVCMKKLWVSGVTVLLMLAANPLAAGGDNGYVSEGSGYKTGGFFGIRGGYSFSVQGSWIGLGNGTYFDDNHDGDGASFGAHLGGQEGQWRATLAYEYYDNDDQNYDLFLGQVDYLFLPNPGTFQPYLGVDAGYVSYETTGAEDSGGFAYGGAAGITFAISDHIDVNVEGRYLFATQDELDHIGTVSVGLNYFY